MLAETKKFIRFGLEMKGHRRPITDRQHTYHLTGQNLLRNFLFALAGGRQRLHVVPP